MRAGSRPTHKQVAQPEPDARLQINILSHLERHQPEARWWILEESGVIESVTQCEWIAIASPVPAAPEPSPHRPAKQPRDRDKKARPVHRLDQQSTARCHDAMKLCEYGRWIIQMLDNVAATDKIKCAAAKWEFLEATTNPQT
jgi:hypothetical protein